jgi:hypothetical protein
MDLKETECEHEDWIHLVQESGRIQWRALMSTVMNLLVPYKEGNLLDSREISFSGRNLLHGSFYKLIIITNW